MTATVDPASIRAVLKLLEALKKRGTPVDALGVQSHLGSKYSDTPTGLGALDERLMCRDKAELRTILGVVTQHERIALERVQLPAAAQHEELHAIFVIWDVSVGGGHSDQPLDDVDRQFDFVLAAERNEFNFRFVSDDDGLCFFCTHGFFSI